MLESLKSYKQTNKQTPPALQPPPLNQEGELEAIVTKKLSLFCKRDEEQDDRPATEGVRNTTSYKQTNAHGLMKPRELGTPLGN